MSETHDERSDDPSTAAPTRDLGRASDVDEAGGAATSSPEPGGPGGAAPPDEALLVVGVGASAGGLDALRELIPHLPAARMAYVVVQHLDPSHESALTELLGRSARLPVIPARDGVALAPGTVYVIQPGDDLAVMHGVLHVFTPPHRYGPRLPIDFLFRSLADDLGPAAIGVVLSGTGSDGTFGLRAIKAAGGITFVQEPASAKFDSMPRSALAGGVVDFSLTPRAIGEELARIARQPRSRPHWRSAAPPQFVQDQLGKLFVSIRAEFGNDLSQYKTATLERRIERRMALHKIDRLDDYVRLVHESRDELHALYADMLITVTSFFRDPEVFAALKAEVIPRLLELKPPSEPLRVWVPACATGEEAYSIAICLLEVLDERSRDAQVQVFGTDVDEDSIQFARRGLYPTNITQDVAPERLGRYFDQREGGFTIARRVRDLVVFSRQNLLKDAPFSRMDLVSCRNLLIYLQPPAQQRVLRPLHYALNPHGFLVLGSSETVGDAPEHFTIVDRKHKIFAKRQAPAHTGRDVSFGVPAPPAAPSPPASPRPGLSLQALADRKVLELYGPPGVVINEGLEVLHFRGRTGPFLDPTPGTASFDVLKVARFELHVDLKRAIRQALAEDTRVTAEVTYHDEGAPCSVRLDVVPLQDPESQRRCLLVLFHRLPPPREAVVVPASEGADDDARGPLIRKIRELERELAATKDYLQATIEDKEIANEELQSANEELQSANEELQSTNEELETSKEEMQSTNEELTTVNEELQNRMAELGQTNDDLHNVLAGVDNAVIIVDLELRIRRYTAAAERLFNLVAGDVGRGVGFLEPLLGVGALADKVAGVIERLTPVDEELLASNQRWYALKICPYKTLDHAIRGALIVLVDIDVRRRATEMQRDVGAYAARFLAAISHPLLIIDRGLRVVWANDAFFAALQLAREETVGSALPSVGRREWADPGLLARLGDVFAASSVFRDYPMELTTPGGERRVVRVGAGQIPATAEVPLALLSIEPAAQERR